jgi:hypothetical protein
MPKMACIEIVLFVLLCIDEITGTHHQVQPLVEMGSHEILVSTGLKP